VMDGAVLAHEAREFEALRAEFFPDGVVKEAPALRLLDRLAPHGRLADPAAVAMLLRVMETARQVPPSLPTFLLEQLHDAIIAGEGPAIGARCHFSRVIDAEDVKLIRRVLEAAASKPVSRGEAVALFDLHDASAGSSNDPGFDDLFFRAVAQHLLAASGHPVPPRREALAGGWAPAHPLGSEEAAWLSRHIMRDSRPTTAELKLLTLFGQEPGATGASLRHFVDYAA